MSNVPLAVVSLTEETLSCDTIVAVEAVEVVVALVAANELVFTEETLESFELLIFENKL